MIELYTWKTSNSQKVNIAVCELGVDFTVHPIDINAGAQKTADYLAINPNGKVPAIRDLDTGITLFESGTILLYLAEKAGKLMPEKPRDRWTAVQWIMWQMSSIGPVGGQMNHFRDDPSRGAYALERFSKEFRRLLSVLDGQLARSDYLAGDYSVADISVWPWLSRFPRMGIDLNETPAVARWYTAIAERPAVRAGFQILNEDAEIPIP